MDLEEQYRRARSYVRRLGVKVPDAEDIVQDTLVRLWLSGKDYNPSYLYTALRWRASSFARDYYPKAEMLSLDLPVPDNRSNPVNWEDILQARGNSVEYIAQVRESLSAVETRWPGKVADLALESRNRVGGTRMRSWLIRHTQELREIYAEHMV